MRTYQKSAKRFEKHKEKNSSAPRGLARSMGHDHDGHGSDDPGTEFPIHPMRASGQCPDTIADLGKIFLHSGSRWYNFEGLP